MENRRQFTFYRSFYVALQNLETKEDQADFYNAICNYALNGIEPEFTGILKMAWELVKPNLDTGRRKAMNGKKGGEAIKRKEKSQEKNNSNKKKQEKNKNKKLLVEEIIEEEEKEISENQEEIKEEIIENKEDGEKINQKYLVDFQYLQQEYENGNFDFDLMKFWNFWKNKALLKTELTNKMIAWDIKDRDKKKMQNLTQKINLKNNQEQNNNYY